MSNHKFISDKTIDSIFKFEQNGFHYFYSDDKSDFVSYQNIGVIGNIRKQTDCSEYYMSLTNSEYLFKYIHYLFNISLCSGNNIIIYDYTRVLKIPKYSTEKEFKRWCGIKYQQVKENDLYKELDDFHNDYLEQSKIKLHQYRDELINHFNEWNFDKPYQSNVI